MLYLSASLYQERGIICAYLWKEKERSFGGRGMLRAAASALALGVCKQVVFERLLTCNVQWRVTRTWYCPSAHRPCQAVEEWSSFWGNLTSLLAGKGLRGLESPHGWKGPGGRWEADIHCCSGEHGKDECRWDMVGEREPGEGEPALEWWWPWLEALCGGWRNRALPRVKLGVHLYGPEMVGLHVFLCNLSNVYYYKNVTFNINKRRTTIQLIGSHLTLPQSRSHCSKAWPQWVCQGGLGFCHPTDSINYYHLPNTNAN